jgi:hypothetical protein
LNDAEWKLLKQNGSEHYKTGRTEPIDLYLSGDMFQDFALASIIKYAFRSRKDQYLTAEKFNTNMDKIIDYAQKAKAFYGDEVMP